LHTSRYPDHPNFPNLPIPGSGIYADLDSYKIYINLPEVLNGQKLASSFYTSELITGLSLKNYKTPLDPN
jgi:hypothetical protein